MCCVYLYAANSKFSHNWKYIPRYNLFAHHCVAKISLPHNILPKFWQVQMEKHQPNCLLTAQQRPQQQYCTHFEIFWVEFSKMYFWLLSRFSSHYESGTQNRTLRVWFLSEFPEFHFQNIYMYLSIYIHIYKYIKLWVHKGLWNFKTLYLRTIFVLKCEFKKKKLEHFNKRITRLFHNSFQKRKFNSKSVWFLKNC